MQGEVHAGGGRGMQDSCGRVRQADACRVSLASAMLILILSACHGESNGKVGQAIQMGCPLHGCLIIPIPWPRNGAIPFHD